MIVQNINLHLILLCIGGHIFEAAVLKLQFKPSFGITSSFKVVTIARPTLLKTSCFQMN